MLVADKTQRSTAMMSQQREGKSGGTKSPLQFFERLYLLLLQLSWRFILFVLVLHFLSGWALIYLFEAYLHTGTVEITTAKVYWWFYVVTGTTVGYGDFAPSTLGGRLSGVYIMLGGIGFFAALIARLADAMVSFSRRIEMGEISLNETKHVVILGYVRGRTEALVEEILADSNRENRTIVLVTDNSITENPMVKKVKFVRGMTLSSSNLMQRACVSDAARIIIFTENDGETLRVGLSVSQHASSSTQIVAYFQEEEDAKHLQSVRPQVECISSVAISMMVQAMQDPGASVLIGMILSNHAEGTVYRVDIEEKEVHSWEFSVLHTAFLRKYQANIVGIADSHVGSLYPVYDSNELIRGGMSLFYIAEKRLTNVDWASI